MKLKIALLQINSNGFNQEANKHKGELFCRKAKEQAADLVLFPEMWNIGYTAFDDAVWQRDFDPLNISSAAKDAVKNWYNHALKINSSFVQHFVALAKELNLAIALSFLQKEQAAKPYNSVIIINKEGKIILNYSKVHTCDFSLENFCEPGDEFAVCELITKQGAVILGAMICYDREFPESARILMLKGAEIILIPNSCHIDIHRTAALRTRAYENMVGVAMANYPFPKCNGLSQAWSPVAYNNDEQPAENLLVMATEEEGIFIAEFDMDAIRAYRETETWGNAYRKPKAYKELTDDKVLKPFIRTDAKR